MARGKIKVSELEGAELDFWVANAEGFSRTVTPHGSSGVWVSKGFDGFPRRKLPKYSSVWNKGGPILEREGIEMSRRIASESAGSYVWLAQHPKRQGWKRGAIPLIAAMRAYVSSRYGEEVTE